MLSMTGFGSGDSSAGNLTITVELRAVNHRFLDVTVKAPPQIAILENDIRIFLKERLARGRITCSVQLSRPLGSASVQLDEERLNHALALLEKITQRLAQQTGKQPEIELSHLLAVPDLLQSEEEGLDIDTLRPVVLAALEQAAEELVAMKVKEGRELAQDLERRLATLQGHLDQVKALAPTFAQEAHRKLVERLEQLALEQIDPQRLAQEAALIADRSNINEECERLASHCEQFAQTVRAGGQGAKRLNFLLQEMHREVNTMGAKTNLLDLTQLVIAMKEEIESMREQVQNLE